MSYSPLAEAKRVEGCGLEFPLDGKRNALACALSAAPGTTSWQCAAFSRRVRTLRASQHTRENRTDRFAFTARPPARSRPGVHDYGSRPTSGT